VLAVAIAGVSDVVCCNGAPFNMRCQAILMLPSISPYCCSDPPEFYPAMLHNPGSLTSCALFLHFDPLSVVIYCRKLISRTIPRSSLKAMENATQRQVDYHTCCSHLTTK
jgi:hypothetical protein